MACLGLIGLRGTNKRSYSVAIRDYFRSCLKSVRKETKLLESNKNLSLSEQVPLLRYSQVHNKLGEGGGGFKDFEK